MRGLKIQTVVKWRKKKKLFGKFTENFTVFLEVNVVPQNGISFQRIDVFTCCCPLTYGSLHRLHKTTQIKLLVVAKNFEEKRKQNSDEKIAENRNILIIKFEIRKMTGNDVASYNRMMTGKEKVITKKNKKKKVEQTHFLKFAMKWTEKKKKNAQHQPSDEDERKHLTKH